MKITALCSKMKNAFFLQFSNRDLKIGHTFYVHFLKIDRRIKTKKYAIYDGTNHNFIK